MDVFDRAQELEERQRDMALKQQAERANLGGASSETCACGADIPKARRMALPGVKTCVDCQQRAEIKGRQYR